MTSIIGEDVRVAGARNSLLIGLRGRIVLETMHTLTISTDTRRKITIPKSGSALELKDGKIMIGDDIEGRLEDRIAGVGRRTR